MYILVHRAVLNRRNTVLSVLLSLLFTSCGLFDKDDEIQTEKIIFTDHAIESVTNLNGELDIETVVKSGYRVLYDIKIVNKLDQPIEDWVIQLSQPDDAGFEGREWKPVFMSSSRHRGYAFQWFALVAACFAMWVYLGFRKTPGINK